MSLDSKIWISTLPGKRKNNINENFDVLSEKWVNTIPQRKTNSKLKFYSITSTIFILGLILVSVIKNETRGLQKEIDKLQASVNVIKLDLHKAELDYEVITSPNNLSILAKTYLNSDLVTYERAQIKKNGENNKQLTKLKLKKETSKIKRLTKKTKENISKELEIKKEELKKLQEIYSNPSELPKEAKITFQKKIKKVKEDIFRLKESPEDILTPDRIVRWTGIQLVKAFLGMPVIPGK